MVFALGENGGQEAKTMTENKVCRVCGVPLVVGENVTLKELERHKYICRACRCDHLREFRRRRVQSHATCENKVCIKCGVPLVIGENVTQSSVDHSIYTCQVCQRKHDRERYCRKPPRQVASEKRICNKCGVPLVIGETVSQSQITHHHYVCQKCSTMRQRDYNHRTGRNQPMSEKRDCPQFLGVHVAERVLSSVFKDVKRMSPNNPGYDFRCGCGYLVDAKSSCRRQHLPPHADQWSFHINKNKIAEYFLCLAFDNRDDLTPEHIWLIPAEKVNDKVGISIAETRLDKWKEYELPIDQVASCCDTIRGH